MTEVLDLYIKDLIVSFPVLGAVLAEAGIGCVGCSVGTCLLKDIVGIHNLTEVQERALLVAIAGVIFPGTTPDIPKIARKAAPAAGPKTLSPPIQELVNEHTVIKRVIAQLPALAERLKAGVTTELKGTIADALEFIREYADRFHHAKEEDILFGRFDGSSDILVVMCKEHEIGRGYVRAAREAVEQGDALAVIAALKSYGALLTEHIRKEDEILYPWMNRELTDTQVGRLFSKFAEVDARLGAQVKRCLELVKRLEAGPARKG